MRVFWGCLAILVAFGLWFMVQPGLGGARSGVNGGSGMDAGPGAGTEPPPDASDLTAPDARSAAETTPLSTPLSTPPKLPSDSAPPVAASASPTAITTKPPIASGQPEANATQGTPPAPEIDLLGESGVVVIPASAPRVLRTDDRKPSDIVRRIDERTLELDGRFRVTGNGSDADPYVITWEMLTSASEYVDPAQNARTPPPWVRILDGTYVEISGYYSTAVRMALAKNLLLTLNRWDGCCIGVPPTAFDAIDITMRDPLPMRGLHLTRFGTFKGLFRAECLDAAGFLIGLYRLEDTTFETK